MENNVNIKLNTRTVHERNGEFCYKERVGRRYEEVQVSREDVYSIEKYYRINKSIPELGMLIVRVKQVTETEFKPYVCVIYHRTKSDSGEEDSIQIFPHANTKNKHKDNPYIRTSKTTLDKVDNSLSKGKSISNGLFVQTLNHPNQGIESKLCEEKNY